MRSLRTQLLISHSLPLLVMMLLAGFTLDYVLETRILLPSFADELANEAKLLAELAALQPTIWDDPQAARVYLARLEPILAPSVSIFNSQGKLLSSTDPFFDSANLPEISLETVLSEYPLIQTAYSRQSEASVVDVLIPVRDDTEAILGIIQMTYHLENVYGQFLALRRVILGILTISVILGAGIALLFAVNMSRALQQITGSIRQLAARQGISLLPEEGPEEIRDLIRTVNLLMTQLQNLESNRRKLIANLVHELGRPLGALLLTIQALEAGAAENESLRKEMLLGMEYEIGILRRLLDDLTGFHDHIEGSFVLDYRLVNLDEWIPNLFQAHREAAKAKGLSWQCNILNKLPSMEVDPDRLTQAIGNLVHNAIKFTPQGGTITVDAGLQADEVWIRVQDTGPGIPVEDQSFLFTPLYRGQSDKRFPQGMGLGLSIARELVIAHQGRLEFESMPEKGSCFIIWLPIQPEKISQKNVIHQI